MLKLLADPKTSESATGAKAIKEIFKLILLILTLSISPLVRYKATSQQTSAAVDRIYRVHDTSHICINYTRDLGHAVQAFV
jgi:hypothetical protein